MIHWNTPTPPEAPFFASIFNYYLSDDLEGYAEYDKKTLELVKTFPGYLGYESLKHDGRGMFISYWKDMDSIKAWGFHQGLGIASITSRGKGQWNKRWFKSSRGSRTNGMQQT